MSIWRVELVLKAEDDLTKIDHLPRRQIIERMEWLATNFNSIQPIPLHADFKGYFKLRVGDWRVVYNFDSDAFIIRVHKIDHRDKVYKKRK